MKFRTEEVSALLNEYLKRHSIVEVANNSRSPESMARRLHDIKFCRTKTVTLKVFDEVALACDHPHWIHELEPV